MAAIIRAGSGFEAAGQIWRSLKTLVRITNRQIKRLDRALRNRQAMRVLARMDDRMLADIGITRADLRDAYAQSLWRDPAHLLRARAIERRLARFGISHGFETKRPPAPPLAPRIDDITVSQAREAFCNNK